jgi:hypothetical protein
LIALQEMLGNFPPGGLKSVTYSKNGLAFELQDSVFSQAQQLTLANNELVESIGPSHYLLKPYANLGYE